MKVFIIIIILALLAGGGFWIWKANQDNKSSDSNLVTSVTAFNQTQNIDAVVSSARAQDSIVYTLTVENTGEDVASGYVVEINIGDISQSATLLDTSGANYNSANNSLVWTPLDVPAQGSITKKFTVKVKDVQASNSDYVMATKFNNELAINIQKAVTVTPLPAPQPTPPAPYQAPTTGPTGLMVLYIALGLTVGIGLLQLGRRISARS